MSFPTKKVQQCTEHIERLLDHIYRQRTRFEGQLASLPAEKQNSAINLLDYLCLRSEDVRQLQEDLASMSLSSLGRAESNVEASLTALLTVLKQLQGATPEPTQPLMPYGQGDQTLVAHAEALLGKVPSSGQESPQRDIPIMVTMPSHAAEDYDLVEALLKAGMNIARINCGHDYEGAWKRMVTHIRKAEAQTQLKCRIMLDLAGPKMRVGPLKPGPKVLSWRPTRDKSGEVVAPALIWFAPELVIPLQTDEEDSVVHVSPKFLKKAKHGDTLQLRDRRGKKRKLRVIEVNEDGVWATTRRAAYIEPGIQLNLLRGKEKIASTEVHSLPPIEKPVYLRMGDTLIIQRVQKPGRPAVIDESGKLLKPARISCTMPEIFDYVKEGESVKFDDGKIEGRIVSVKQEELTVEITHAKPTGTKLKADKGINFPDSDLMVEGLTDSDRQHLDFALEHADMVSLSFVNSPEDVRQLQKALEDKNATHLGIILKIETQRGFNNLPQILMQSMKSKVCGVMIARGDLAVEHGWVRMAEIQEEILWLCEAAHVPVIWATQVLESMAKKGLPSRSEITDAAMAQRAECVMLNKGPFIEKAVGVLNEILVTMKDHQHKKMAMLRSLSVSEFVTDAYDSR